MKWEWSVDELETRASLLVSALWRTFFLVVTVLANWNVLLHAVEEGDLLHRILPRVAVGFALTFWGVSTVVFWWRFAVYGTGRQRQAGDQRESGAALGRRSIAA
jgi:hypothetical protein